MFAAVVHVFKRHLPLFQPGAVARLEVCPLVMQAAPSSISKSGTFFRGDLALK